MPQGRVQVSDLQSNVQLKPAPMQSDTYAPPPRPIQDDRAERLANALGAFSGTLGNLVGIVGKTSKEEQARQDAIFQKRIAGQTLEEVRTDIKSGRMDVTQDKIANAARQSVYGSKWAQSEAANTEKLLNTEFDWENGDPEAFLAKHFQTAVEESGLSDPNAIASAARTWDQYKAGVLQRQHKYRIDRTNQSTADTAFTVVKDKAQQWIADGVDPVEFAGRLNKMRSELGVKGSLGANEEMLDQEFLNTARELAQSNPKYAIAMLDAEYSTRSGKSSLSDQRAYRDRALQIKAMAGKAIAVQAEHDTLDGITADNVQRLKDGTLDYVDDYSYTDHNGEEKVLTAKSQKDEARRLYLRQSQGEAKVNRENGEETMRREYRALRAVDEKHPQLEASLKGIADMASADVAADPTSREKLVGKLKVYEWLSGESKNSVIAYTNEKDRDFAEAFWAAKSFMVHEDGFHFNDDEAITFALNATNPLSKVGLSQIDRDTLDAKINDLGSEPGWLWGANDVSPLNWSAARQKVGILATNMVQAGAKPDKAVDMAAQMVKNGSTTYRGRLLDLQGMVIPDNFPKVMDKFIENFAKEEPETLERLGVDPSEISIEPSALSGGRFRLIEKDTGVPILDHLDRQKYFTLKQLNAVGKKMEADTLQTKAQDYTIRSSAEANGYVYSTVPGQEDVWVNKKTGEIMTVEFNDGSTKPIWKKTGKRQKQLVEQPSQFR